MIRKAILTSTTALCLSVSAPAVSFMTVDEATLPEQLVQSANQMRQIEIQREELTAAMQLLETADIGGPAAEIMGQMEGLADQTGYIMEESPPESLTTCDESMSTRQFRARMAERNDYSMSLSVFFAETLAELADGSVLLMNLSNSLDAAGEPISPIGATQADVLAQASATVEDQRESTKQLMVYKEDQIEKQLDDGDACAIAAHNVCITTGNCPAGESLSASEEQAIVSGLGPPSMNEIGISEHGNVIEENSGALLGTDGTARATLYEVQMDGSLSPVRTYDDNDAAANCDTDVTEMNNLSLGAYFKCE